MKLLLLITLMTLKLCGMDHNQTNYIRYTMPACQRLYVCNNRYVIQHRAGEEIPLRIRLEVSYVAAKHMIEVVVKVYHKGKLIFPVSKKVVHDEAVQ